MAAFEPVASYELRGINPDRLAAIERHVVGSVLDIGAGSGAYVERVPGAIGIDRTQFSTWTVGRYAVGDASSLPFRDASFDTGLVFETLEHLPRPAEALAEYRRVLRKVLILTVPNCEITPGMRGSNLIYHHWVDPTHVNFWTLDAIADLVASAGFRVIEKGLINRIDPFPLLDEMFSLPHAVKRVLRRAGSRFAKPYRMTSLIVASPK